MQTNSTKQGSELTVKGNRWFLFLLESMEEFRVVDVAAETSTLVRAKQPTHSTPE
jgi:hypothetical protein